MAARADLTVQVMGRAIPLEPVMTNAVVADGHMFLNDGHTYLFLIGGTVNCEITVQTPGTVDGLAIADLVFDVPATATEYRMMGPFPPDIYSQSDRKVYIDWEVANIANVKVAVVRMPI